jgi:F-type H+-transporting ATPase subunit b
MMRRTALAVLLAIAGLLLVAASLLPLTAVPALAEDAVETPASVAAAEGLLTDEMQQNEAHGGQGAGMPQLNAGAYASQILWLIITFSVLYYLLKKKALPRVADILEARQERISNDLDKAANLRAEAEAAAEEYAKVVAEAQEQASRAIAATRDAVNAEVSSRTAALDKDLSAKIRAAEASIDKARGQALAELEGVAVEVAQAAIQRLVGVNVTVDEAKAALAAVQKEVA